MHLRGHVGAALFLYAPVGGLLARSEGPALAALGIGLAVALSTLPDADEYLPIEHRGVTHTVWFMAVFSLVFAAVGMLFGTYIGRPVVVGGLFGTAAVISLSAHLLADSLTPMGIRPFYPLSAWHHSFDITPSRNPRANTTMLAAGGLFVLVWQAIVFL